MYEGVQGLASPTLGETGVKKFNDTTGVVGAFGCGALSYGGETPPAIMAEVGVGMSHITSPQLDITELKGTPTPSEPKG